MKDRAAAGAIITQKRCISSINRRRRRRRLIYGRLIYRQLLRRETHSSSSSSSFRFVSFRLSSSTITAENTEFMPSLTERRPCTADINRRRKMRVSCRFIIARARGREQRARATRANKILARIPFRRQCVEHLEHVQGC